MASCAHGLALDGADGKPMTNQVAQQDQQERTLRVLFCCSGVGIFNRGIETFFREAFDGLKSTPEFQARLLKGAGEKERAERAVPCLARTSRAAPLLGRFTKRSAYAVEQWSSFPFVVQEIRRFRPDVVFTSEANLLFLLRRFRRFIGVPYRLLFSNGGPCHPPFDRYDFVHQVAPWYLKEALDAGEPPEKHFMVPYGTHVPAAPAVDPIDKVALRQTLGQPVNRPVVLSVGWIARQHKRMDYVIEEVARLPEPRPYLQLLGAMDEHSSEIVELGNRLLGPQNFSARSVPPDAVTDYYRAADVFVLGSLVEGFGRVYLESLMHGLPTIAHWHPVMEYVLGDVGTLADLSTAGSLAQALQEQLTDPETRSDATRQRRWNSVRSRFSWEVLRPQYAAMFQACAARPFPNHRLSHG